MATWQDIITAAQTLLQRWKRDVDFTSQIVNGPATGPNSVVNTDGGTIPTFAKTLGDAAAESQSLRSDLANTSDPLKGDALVGVKRTVTGAIATTVHQWLDAQVINLKSEFGAVGNGVANDDAAIAAWLSLAGPGVALYAPAGVYLFTNAKVAPLLNNITIYGDGSSATVFLYGGANTTNTLMTFGDGTTSISGIELHGFSVDSSTTMTSGSAIRIRKYQGGRNNIRDVNAGLSDATRKLWDGVRFDNVNVFKYDGFDIKVQNEALIANGTATTDEASDLWLDHGFILGGVNPIHIGGGIGGVYFGQVLAYGGTGVSMLIDQTLANRTNREIVLSAECVLDGANSSLLRINNPDGVLIVDCNAFLSGAGFFSATPGDNIDVQSMPSGRLTIGSSHIKSAARHGIKLGDNSTFVTISDKTNITDCAGWGIFSDASNQNVQNQSRVMFNTLGNIHANVQAFIQTGTGVASTSGTITTSSGTLRYRLIGGVCHCYSELTITTNGTGAGALIQTLPFPMKNNCVGFGAVITSGKSVSVRGDSVNVSNVIVLHYDGTYPGADGAVIRTWITYEVSN